MSEPSIHTLGDGRGRRKVFVDGQLVENCFYADTEKGVARFYPKPVRIIDNDRIHEDEKTGVVTVEYVNG